MKVVVQAEKCPNATWHADLTPNTRIDDIKLKFCQQNGLSPGTCVLSSKGVLLKDQPKSGNKVQLRATFPPTLSFYIAYSLKPTDASEYELLSRVWQAAAEFLCSNKHIATLMSDKTLQSQIAALPAEESLPFDSSQTQKELTVEVLSKLSEAARPLLICVQILRTAQPVLTGLPQKISSLNVTLAKLCEVKPVSEPSLPLPQSRLFRHVAVLRSALLVVKAAIVSAEGFGNPSKPYPSKQTLWNTVHIIGAQVYDSAIDAKARLTELPSAGSPLAADIDQAQHLSSLLIHLIMPILKQHVKGSLHAGQQPRDYMPAFCCIMLDSLLTKTESPVLQALTQAAASHMLKSGGLTFLTAALEQVNSVARYAFTVLQRLLAKDILPIEQAAANEALLAHMQGLRRCSALLCPLFSQDQALQARRAEAFDAKSMTDVSQREGHIDFLYAVTAVMARLLSRQPLSPPPEAYDGDLLDAYPPWPTPTASQWAEVQTIALRVMVLLEWCTEELALNEHTMEDTGDLIALKQTLVLLLHQLLLAHMQNAKLSMNRVFRFGFAPIMSEWIACEPDFVPINNLGFAFLRRISSDKAIFETMASAEPGHQFDCVCRIWTLLYSDLGTPLDIFDPFQQLRCTEAIEALHAAPLTHDTCMQLAELPALASSLSLAMEHLPKLSNRLTACAVFAQLCCAELGEGSGQGALGGPVHPDPYPYCSKSAEKGNFLTLYASITEAVEASESWTTEDIVGLARVLTSCSNLFQIMPAHLPQPPLLLAGLLVDMLPRIPESTSNPHLQEHLIRAALHFTTSIDKQPGENGGQILQGLVKALIPMLPLWASPASHPADLGYSDIGLPPLEPKLMQAKALALVMPVVEMQQLFPGDPALDNCVDWVQSSPALESCVEWFLNTTQRCMAAANESVRPDDWGLVCNMYMAPYPKLISLFTNGFQSTLLPQAVVPKEIARATFQLLFLCLKNVLQAYKTVELACMPQPPGDQSAYDSSLTQSQIAAKLAGLDTRPGPAVKDEHARLLDHRSFLVEDVVPFIDKMCRSGVWIEALGGANAGLTWCTSRYQADWKRNFGQLLRQHVISDAIGYKLEVIFGLEPGQEAFVLAPGGKSSFSMADIMSWRDDMLAMGAKRRVTAPGAAKRRNTTDRVVVSTSRSGSTAAFDLKQTADNAREYMQYRSAARPSAADPNKANQLAAKATTAAQTAPVRVTAKPVASEAMSQQKGTSDADAELAAQAERLRVRNLWQAEQKKVAHQTALEENQIEAEAAQKAKQEALAKAEAAERAVHELLAEEEQAAHQAAAKKAKKDRRKAKKQQQQEEELLQRQQQQQQEEEQQSVQQEMRHQQQLQEEPKLQQQKQTLQGQELPQKLQQQVQELHEDQTQWQEQQRQWKKQQQPQKQQRSVEQPPIQVHNQQAGHAAGGNSTGTAADFLSASKCDAAGQTEPVLSPEPMRVKQSNGFKSGHRQTASIVRLDQPGHGVSGQYEGGVPTVDGSLVTGRQKRFAAPHHLLCCPITQELMVDPVIAADGHTYERDAFEKWLLRSSTSPALQAD
ncbi:hypothetical protein WJX77_008253 [Trebouxia sp. C0004]